MSLIIGVENFARVRRENLLQDSDADFLLRLAIDMNNNPNDWRGFGYLNSDDPEKWDTMLYKVIRLKSRDWDGKFSNIVATTKAISYNWDRDLPSILSDIKIYGIDIDDFFKIERTITFKLSALLSDVNALHKMIVDSSVDISAFIGRMSRAFLPSAVYHLEEYGLPRMISKKIHASGLIDFIDPEMDLLAALERFNHLGLEAVLAVKSLGPFDRYIVKFFFDGITPAETNETE